MTLAVTPTIACLHALRVAVFLRVPGNGSHIGHVVTLSVGVGRVRRVSRHVRRGRVVLCEADGERELKQTAVTHCSPLSLLCLSSAVCYRVHGQLDTF